MKPNIAPPSLFPCKTQIWHQWLFFLIIEATFLLVTLFTASNSQAAATADYWAFADRDYRMPLTVQANGFAREDKITEIELDFSAQLTALGATGNFDEESLRVAEVDGNGAVLNTAVSFQFDNGDTANESAGTLIFLLDGTTASSANRYYHIYFDTTGTFAPPPALTDRVERLDDKWFHGQLSFVLNTRDANGDINAAYYYHKTGAAFASIYDRQGNDWVGYHQSNPESSGVFRGIPNLGNVFHPGYNNNSGADQGSNSSIIEDGPLRLTIRSISKDGNWEALWHIYPVYIQMTLVAHPANINYWMLYEGVPGGELNYSSGATLKDTVVLSNGATQTADQNFNDDFSEDWAYIADGTIDRSLFIAHSPNDSITDLFRKQDDFDDGGDGNAMAIFGFGRDWEEVASQRLLSADGATFTVGFIDDRAYSSTAVSINGILQDLDIMIENEPPEMMTNAGLTVNEGETAVITPTHLAAKDPEGGLVIYTIGIAPTKGTLYHNATPLNNGESFTQADIAAGNVAYLHDGSETVRDSFTFTAADGVQSTGMMSFVVSVTAVNDPPNTVADTETAVSNIPRIFNLLQNDTDPDSPTFNITSLTQPSHGQVRNNGDGTITFTADENYIGSDAFTYWASDGDDISGETAVSINVQAPRQLYLPILIKP